MLNHLSNAFSAERSQHYKLHQRQRISTKQVHNNELFSSLWIFYCMLSLSSSFTSALHCGTQLRHLSTESSRFIPKLPKAYFLKPGYITKSFPSIMTISHIKSLSTEELTIANEKRVAKLISASHQSISDAGLRIRSGNLVSFPTETVYGLGCHALDQLAVQRVFQAKERPLTDPLIVHVVAVSDALNLWNASSSDDQSTEKNVLQTLTAKFWPGPLTIVSRASAKVPSIIMANTGFVACRSPSHPIARALITASGVPIAAPSANKFGHVSPTRAQHVFDDLGMEDVWIIDPALEKASSSQGVHDESVVCDVGVESTVVKIDMKTPKTGEIVVLRHGAISSHDIFDCLQANDLAQHFEVKAKPQSTGEAVKHVAPGQTIRHYSPNVLSYMIAQRRYAINNANDSSSDSIEWNEEDKQYLKSAVIIDFGGRLQSCRAFALAYRDLSKDGDSKLAAANVFDSLRWSETVNGANRVYFPEISVDDMTDALILAVKDRLTRAASGVVILNLI